MQVRNPVDWRMQLAPACRLRIASRLRDPGITHHTASAYADIEAMLRAEKPDFLRINHALGDRAAASACWH